jgi:hypothetical protein
MSKILPPLENIERLKVKPTEGEFFLLKYLDEKLSSEYEIFFQPFLNGDMPDIVFMRKGAGVVVVEVKDWNLDCYKVNEKNEWTENVKNHKIRSPFKQVFGYKSNMFKIHIDGLAEKNVINKNFYNTIKPYVYFHGSTKEDIDKLYKQPLDWIKNACDEVVKKFKEKTIDHNSYEKQILYYDQKIKQFNRDKRMSLIKISLDKLIESIKTKHVLFTDDIYNEFKRYLSPPYHVSQQGILINYQGKQVELIESKPGFQKIKGVAGSGKTTILAKRAVNGHKKHGDKILILTFNKTLRNYIRDKISEVREDFSWSAFGIANYHSIISQTINTCGIDIYSDKSPESIPRSIDAIYSDETIFDGYEDYIYKYQTILVDEIQDYKPEWVKIIRKFFLAANGEMVLFGDDCQNIYDRNITKKNPVFVRGFGEWKRLTKSFRSKIESPLNSMAKNFQEKYLNPRYDIDLLEVVQNQGLLLFDVLEGYKFNDINDTHKIVDKILDRIKKEKIHPNDVCIISTDILLMQKIDELLKLKTNQKTQMTFETKSEHESIQKNSKNNKKSFEMEIETIRSSKKFSFNLNSGITKISTVHSFKGLEAQCIIYLLSSEDNEEMVYTGITRSNRNFIVFLQNGNKYIDFFNSNLKILDLK